MIITRRFKKIFYTTLVSLEFIHLSLYSSSITSIINMYLYNFDIHALIIM